MGNATKGALWTVASALSFMAANLLIKHVSTKLPAMEMALFRSAGGIVLAVVAWRAFLHLRQLQDPQGHVIRAAVGAVSLMALVHAYSSPALPVALVTAFMYTRVLLVIPMQRLFLGERTGLRVWLAAGIGIGGAVVALWPRLMAIGTPHWDWAVASLAIAAFAGAGSQIAMRRLARTNPASVVVAVSAVLISAIVAFPASAVMVEPSADDLPWLVGIALLSAGAQWSTVRGYKHASPAVLMPVTLIDVPVALAAGYLLFGETPNLNAAVGAAIIIAAAIYVMSMTDERPLRARVASQDG